MMNALRIVLLSVSLLCCFPVLSGNSTVNINTADATTLSSTLMGIGESKAVAIVEYRKLHGPFASVDDLLQVKGIGSNTLEKNRASLATE